MLVTTRAVERQPSGVEGQRSGYLRAWLWDSWLLSEVEVACLATWSQLLHRVTYKQSEVLLGSG